MGTHASHTIFRPGHSGELRYRQENVWKIRLAMDQGLHGRWQDDEPTEEDDEPTEEDFKDEQEEVEQFYEVYVWCSHTPNHEASLRI